jgi:cold shock CspA family protein
MIEYQPVRSGKIAWLSEDKTKGVITDKRGKQVYYFTEQDVVPDADGIRPEPSEGEAVEFMLEPGEQAEKGMKMARSVILLGFSEDELTKYKSFS